jgi:hypothetical protein
LAVSEGYPLSNVRTQAGVPLGMVAPSAHRDDFHDGKDRKEGKAGEDGGNREDVALPQGRSAGSLSEIAARTAPAGVFLTLDS